MGVAEGNVGLAFGLVFAAGLSTTIGSSFAFCANMADQRVLAGALGISAGVMLYVSFAEIFIIKAVEGFEDSGYDGDSAMRYATFCFFAGILLTYALDFVVHLLAGAAGHGHSHDLSFNSIMAPEHGHSHAHGHGHGHDDQDSKCESHGLEQDATIAPNPLNIEGGGPEEESAKDEELQRMGLMTGLAIALHNFPEGLATFVATLADSSLGISIAIAIALHNIPEGVCVAMPIYYATGSKWKGFFWSFMSGVSEPIGGLLGYLVLYGDNMSSLAYGSLFGIVGGMMVYISLKELIPTALKYDPEDKYVTNCVFIGMGVMAASLLMFTA